MSGNRLDGLNLVGAIRNAQLRVELLQFGGAVVALVNQVIKAVFTIETVDLTVRVVLVIIPDEGFVAVTVEDDRALVAHALEGIGIKTGLLAARLQAGVSGFLGFHDGQGLAVIAPQHVVGIALA